MKAMIGDFIGTVVRQYAPKQTAWCVGKFGTCQFHQVCQQPSKEQRDILLHSGEYEENVWSPLT
jgi:predicted RecB family nuclease